MKLSKKKIILLSFTLFSLFFGAGNLIFPPFLGQQAGSKAIIAFIGFIITAVVLPILGVIVVGKFNGLENLGSKVGVKFSIVFTLLIYLSIGPGLGIPRAGSVPFEMAVQPYLPHDANENFWMVVYTLAFFSIVLWLCLEPGKLVKRVGTILTPSLLILIVVMFFVYVIKGQKDIASPQGDYLLNSFVKGFEEGYQTMDAIAALNFGLVVVLTLNSFGIKEKKGIMKYTIIAGIIAGTILMLVYAMLTTIGFGISNIYPDLENGAEILSKIMFKLLGGFGAFILALIFTLACLTTCIGLTNSISLYFSSKFKKISYKKWVVIIVIISFLICNLGLDKILEISVPILEAIYPVSIILIILGLCDNLFKNNRFIYKLCIYATAVISIIYVINNNFNLGAIAKLLAVIPLFNAGFGWVTISFIMFILSLILNLIFKNKKHNKLPNKKVKV